MGNQINFNILTDLIHEVLECPHAFAHLVYHAWESGTPKGAHRIWQQACVVANEHGEPHPDPQLLKVVARHHASDTVYIRSGGNTAVVLEQLGSGSDNSNNRHEWQSWVKLLLPDWTTRR